MANRTPNSLDTILNYDNRDLGQWSEQWSTTHIPGMDNASGRSRNREMSRRRLRLGSLVLGLLLTMHCRLAAAALTGGLFMFLGVLLAATCLLANPLRHFEVYLGQWSISGPGRAFRIIPMLDGIGIAICINAILRAIRCCFVAAIALLYVVHSVSDAQLPFLYCRDFNMKPYSPTIKYSQKTRRLVESNSFLKSDLKVKDRELQNMTEFPTTVGLSHKAWRTVGSSFDNDIVRTNYGHKLGPYQYGVCKENYSGNYPALIDSPPYNFFYVEVARLPNDPHAKTFNLHLMICNILVWLTIWACLIAENIRYRKLVWNNVHMWIIVIPFLWTIILNFAGISSLYILKRRIKKLIKIGTKDTLSVVADGLEVALYIHSAGVGTEIILGKGLNYYANGHIDPLLNMEIVWHSVALVCLSALNSFGTALCALVDSTHLKKSLQKQIAESTLWILPMYSKCISTGTHSHFITTLVFGGLLFSYTSVAFILIKTALHTIFEYKVKLIFVEQVIVAVLIVSCIGLSVPFATRDGIILLESIEALMSGIAVSFVSFLELLALLYVYRAHDFVSDMNVTMEDTTFPSRMAWQWRMIPFFTILTLFIKAVSLAQGELPPASMFLALIPIICVVAAVPLRAIHNSIDFLRRSRRRGN